MWNLNNWLVNLAWESQSKHIQRVSLNGEVLYLFEFVFNCFSLIFLSGYTQPSQNIVKSIIDTKTVTFLICIIDDS